jgi:hypothetical protein
LNARLENVAPEYPANTNCDAAKAIPPGAMMVDLPGVREACVVPTHAPSQDA